MSERFNVTYRLKLFVLSLVKDMRILTILDNIFHVLFLPFSFLSYQWHRLLGRPYHGIWLASSQGNPFRFKYMAQSIDYLAKDLEQRGRPPSSTEVRILEIGAYAGASAIQWGQALKKHHFKEATVYSLDPWKSYLDLKKNPRWRLRIMNHALASGRIFQLFKRNIKAAGVSAMCRQLVGNSAEILPLLKDNSFDLIYIDGDHEAGAVKKDIKNALPLLKDGGLLCGDDLEMQLSGVDVDFVKRHLDLDMAVDPASGVAFHPGVALAVGEFFQKDVPCYEGYWVVQKKGQDFDDVKLDGGPEWQGDALRRRGLKTMTETMNESQLDLLLINPGGRYKIYQKLGVNLTAVEPPLWCRLIGGYARDQDFSVEILDCEADNLETAAIAEKVKALAPRLVAMVVFGHQPSASTQQMASAGEKCQAIKEQNQDIPIIMVGGHVSALPERTLKEEAVDFVCKGEGPVTVAQLLDALKDDRTGGFEDVEGLAWMRDGEPVINPPAALIIDLDRDLHGNVWDLLPMDKYRAHNWQCFGDFDERQPYASIYTTLGCPYKCVFCCINTPFDINRYRMRNPRAVVDEIALLHDTYGVKTFKIIDEMFVLNDRHVNAICDLLIERDYDLNIWAYARVDTVKPEILDKLKHAGFRWLALGIESGSAHVRDGAEKGFSQDDIIAIVRKIQKAGIYVIGNFIFGLPDDDLDTMKQTYDLAVELNCEFINLYSAMAYPGSPLYVQAVSKKLPLPENWSGFSQHSHDCQPLPTDHLSAAEVLGFRDQAFHDYFSNPRYLDMVTQAFGRDTRKHIEGMVRHRLKRKILEERDAAE